jgi:hypothetical protein
MAQIRIRKQARKFLEENGPSTTEKIFEKLKEKSTGSGGPKSVQSLSMILKSDPQIQKIDKVTLAGRLGGNVLGEDYHRLSTSSYSVNLWDIRRDKNE